jgi:hypothetical protein
MLLARFRFTLTALFLLISRQSPLLANENGELALRQASQFFD